MAGAGLGLPVLAKLSPNVTDITEIAAAALAAGADGLTLVNTVMGLAVGAERRRPALGGGGGGLSGPAIKPVALRAVHDVWRAHPGVAIIGTGGVASGLDAVEMMLAGASAVGVGTATFLEPRPGAHRRRARRVVRGALGLPGRRPDRRPPRRGRGASGMTVGAGAGRDPGAPGAAGAAAVRDRLVLGLDVGDLAAATATARRLEPWFATVKVGHELYAEAGPAAFDQLHELGFRAFCDLKLHDIPTTVERAARAHARHGVAP